MKQSPEALNKVELAGDTLLTSIGRALMAPWVRGRQPRQAPIAAHRPAPVAENYLYTLSLPLSNKYRPTYIHTININVQE